MFRNVPCSRFYRRPTKNVIPCLRQQAIYPVDSLTQNFITCLGQRGKKTILAHPLIDQKWEFPQGSSICNSALDQVIHDIFHRFINQKGVIIFDPKGTPGNSSLVSAIQFSKSWPYFRQKMSFLTPVFIPANL